MVHAVTGEKTDVSYALYPRSEHLNKIYIAYKELHKKPKIPNGTLHL